MKLVVGLGNPGSEYVGTRHNVGFDAIDEFAAKLGWIGQPSDFNRVAKSKFNGLIFEGVVGTEKTLLLKPTTFMNVSGKSVQAAMSFYQLVPSDVLIVLDDVTLPSGRLRLRAGGSSGGHNGLKDIARVLATEEYPRLRIGIDPPPTRMAQKDYVLGRFTDVQRTNVNEAIARACGAIATWIDKGIVAAMNQFNVAEDKGSAEC